ncbi:hypothetical protein CEXT_371931 [Caerostris extrusa]|uniref:Uncharacterized protein n=1 Tax=Caerostris extrusa TaxID=172846 RepID=A0AAV4SMJ4_CAEEX|nr:hypothetical protein CEXT_371931 [Caerostris extrusa]
MTVAFLKLCSAKSTIVDNITGMTASSVAGVSFLQHSFLSKRGSKSSELPSSEGPPQHACFKVLTLVEVRFKGRLCHLLKDSFSNMLVSKGKLCHCNSCRVEYTSVFLRGNSNMILSVREINSSPY